ncbi:hypothetical protein TIFTF001_028158 [Ficus carica]|uniref:Uncharacterized protein n=1 Tax=Ficus carica TaxID=3494 RepID=A0AA88DPI4_FICCA|nr:hypothetical protein TIFTF001_028158 [Ficus carica]
MAPTIFVAGGTLSSDLSSAAQRLHSGEASSRLLSDHGLDGTRNTHLVSCDHEQRTRQGLTDSLGIAVAHFVQKGRFWEQAFFECKKSDCTVTIRDLSNYFAKYLDVVLERLARLLNDCTVEFAGSLSFADAGRVGVMESPTVVVEALCRMGPLVGKNDAVGNCEGTPKDVAAEDVSVLNMFCESLVNHLLSCHYLASSWFGNGSRVVIHHAGYRRDVYVVSHRPNGGCQTFLDPAHEVKFPYLALLTFQSSTSRSPVVRESFHGLLSGMSPSRLVLSDG